MTIPGGTGRAQLLSSWVVPGTTSVRECCLQQSSHQGTLPVWAQGPTRQQYRCELCRPGGGDGHSPWGHCEVPTPRSSQNMACACIGASPSLWKMEILVQKHSQLLAWGSFPSTSFHHRNMLGDSILWGVPEMEPCAPWEGMAAQEPSPVPLWKTRPQLSWPSGQ